MRKRCEGVSPYSEPLWFCIIVFNSRRVLFRVASICAFCVCWSANLVSISASRSLVLSESKSIFSEAGEGNSGGVTAISLDDEAENVRSRKQEIWQFVSGISGPGYFILFCCKGTVGSEAGNLSETKGVRLELLLASRADRESKVIIIKREITNNDHT